MAYSLILSQKTASKEFLDLWDSEFKVYSQWGEDGILWFLCDVLKIDKPRFLEIGAGNFTECNSRFLAEFRNASVFLVDARTDLRRNVSKLDLLWKNHIYTLETWVTPSNSALVCEQARETLGRIDILSLDVDGLDFWILSEMDLSDIRILVLEYNPIFGAHDAVTVPRSEFFDRTKEHYSWLCFGVSLNGWIKTMHLRGFIFIGTNRAGNNAFFISNTVDLPEQKVFSTSADLSKYTDWQVRESRGRSGEMTYLNRIDSAKLVSEFTLHDL